MNISKVITIPIRTDGDDYFDKQCPNQECNFEFKVDNNDWKNIFKDEAVYCPKCKHNARAGSFIPPDIKKKAMAQAKEQAMELARTEAYKLLNNFTKDLSRSLRNSPNIKFTPGRSLVNTQRHFIQPISAKTEFEQKIQCDKCNAKYAVIGFAFFCPSCGENSAEKTFDESLEHIEFKQKLSDSVKINETVSKDNAERFKISAIEEGIKECVTTFETYCKTVYNRIKPTVVIKKNIFQKLKEGSDLWKDLLTYGYSDWLDSFELERLEILFQIRHLLIHQKGFVDQDYLNKIVNSPYRIGQKMVLNESDVSELISLIRKIVTNIRLLISQNNLI